MDAETSWLQFLENHCISDILRAEAYESSSAQERQCLKTAIAYHALLGEKAPKVSTVTEYSAQGFRQEQSRFSAPWLLAVASPEFTSPARLIAALMPALLAHVPVFFITLGKPASALLLALELMGIENIYSLESTTQLVEVMQKNTAQTMHKGRCVFLHHNFALCSASSVRSLFPVVEALHIPYFEDKNQPIIFADEHFSGRDLLCFTQPDAHLLEDANAFAHAAFSDSENANNYLQCWQSGMEACWIYANYCSDFYYNIHTSCGLMPNEL